MRDSVPPLLGGRAARDWWSERRMSAKAGPLRAAAATRGRQAQCDGESPGRGASPLYRLTKGPPLRGGKSKGPPLGLESSKGPPLG